MLASLFLSTTDPGSGEFSRDELRTLAGRLPEKLRAPAARYLRSARMFLAWMESTEDLLENRFRVAGGSAINSDGRFYWRLDTADYVEHYGIGLPADFIDHAQASSWVPPIFDDMRFLEIYGELEHVMRAHAANRKSTLETFLPEAETS